LDAARIAVAALITVGEQTSCLLELPLMTTKINLAKVAALLFLAGVFAAFAGEQKTIVGYWKTERNGQCEPQPDVSIRPMSIGFGDDFWCEFTSVGRSGETVKWNGVCAQGDEEKKKASVVATAHGERLTIAIDGAVQGTYRRCAN
jgi:hypothetical protein